MTIHLKQFAIACFFTLSYLVAFLPISLAQNNSGLLKGNVNQENYLAPNKGPSLNMGDLGNKDAFGQGEASSLPSVGETFEPPSDAFDLKANKAAARTSPLNASASSNNPFDQEPNFAGPGVPGLDESAASTPYNLSADQQNQQEAEAADNTPEMQLAWDQWHRRVAEAIFQRFNALAQTAFRYSHPLACYVTYAVTRDGRILNVQLQQKSDNIAFNAMVMMVVNSMSGQIDLLTFPPGSQRLSVNKAGMFTQNYGIQGFKYTTGDRETVPQR